MGDNMKISDTCPCGAEFECEGHPVNVPYRHDAWQKAHAACREAPVSDVSDARYRQLRDMVMWIADLIPCQNDSVRSHMRKHYPDLGAAGDGRTEARKVAYGWGKVPKETTEGGDDGD